MKKQRNTHQHIQNITPSHLRIRQHHLVTHHLIHLSQQTPKNTKRSLENNHWLHSRHQHPTPPSRDQNPPTSKPSQTSRITTHTKSLSPHSSPTPTRHTKNPLQIRKTSHIQQQRQLHPKHTLLHPDHLSHTNKKQHENHTHKNSTRLHIIHSQQNPQQATPTHSNQKHPRPPHSPHSRPTQIKQITFHHLIPRRNLTLISSLTFMLTLPNTHSRHPSPLHLPQNKYHTESRESVDRPRESG